MRRKISFKKSFNLPNNDSIIWYDDWIPIKSFIDQRDEEIQQDYANKNHQKFKDDKNEFCKLDEKTSNDFSVG